MALSHFYHHNHEMLLDPHTSLCNFLSVIQGRVASAVAVLCCSPNFQSLLPLNGNLVPICHYGDIFECDNTYMCKIVFISLHDYGHASRVPPFVHHCATSKIKSIPRTIQREIVRTAANIMEISLHHFIHNTVLNLIKNLHSI